MILRFSNNNEHSADVIQTEHSALEFLVLLIFFGLVLTKEVTEELSCGETNLSRLEGIITSPSYPLTTSSKTICEWKIFSPEDSVVTLTIVDLDLDKDSPCLKWPCCSNQWLLLPKSGSNSETEFVCGNFSNWKVTISKPVLSIKYYSSNSNVKITRVKRGFKIAYQIKKRLCSDSELTCKNDRCVPKQCLCDGVNDCGDGSDEFNCSNISIFTNKYEFFSEEASENSPHFYVGCGEGQRSCESSPGHCYSASDVCDGKFDCPKGEDEVGCSSECTNQIACSSGGCYHPSQRCNYKRNCRDNSDETGCPPEPCLALQFTCLNGACISGTAICDGTNNCGDFSDEENCSNTYYLAAALMGLLSCFFLFFIGISCLHKIYSARIRSSTSFAHQLEFDTIDDEFSYGDPPPAYSVAIGETDFLSHHASAFTEEYLQPDLYSIPSRSNCRNLRCVTFYESEQVSTSSCFVRPSPCLGFINDFSACQCSNDSENIKVESSELTRNSQLTQLTANTTNIEQVFELIGFTESNNLNGGSVLVSPLPRSLSKESVTSSTSLEDNSDLTDFCHF